METEELDKCLVDTSVWIEFFRKREPYYSVVSKLIDEDLVCCIGLIYAELLQGAKSEKELRTLKDFVYVFEFLPEPHKLWERAGVLSYRLRRKGKTVSLSDCYIAIAAIENNVLLLSIDKHFSIIEKETDLKLFHFL